MVHGQPLKLYKQVTYYGSRSTFPNYNPNTPHEESIQHPPIVDVLCITTNRLSHGNRLHNIIKHSVLVT
jgi:hypothetical protein